MRQRGDALQEPGAAAWSTCPSKDWFSEGRSAIVSRSHARALYGGAREARAFFH
jgi:hypothetical protein